MNVLSIEKRAQFLHLLVEGNSMRATSRIADVPTTETPGCSVSSTIARFSASG